jgi:hypothetical protein
MLKPGTIYKGQEEFLHIKFSRVWAMGNNQTFKIKPIKELLNRHVKNQGVGWVDPFCGHNSPAAITNDHNPKVPAMFHMEALDFAKEVSGELEGVIFDPPYSFYQISKHYRVLGMAAGKKTRRDFYGKVKNALCAKVKKGGYAISFGWNSGGFGKARGFKIIEIRLVAHGESRNDTICVVEQKI